MTPRPSCAPFSKDNLGTTVSLGLLAYASADMAHHVFGHGVACLALGGRIISLTSVFVDCSLTGTAIDLAGPLANVVVGLAALLALRLTTRASSTVRLFCILAAAFNLLWFALQLVSSAARKTDDWAWALHQFRVPEPVRYALAAVGALFYLLTVRNIGICMASFAQPGARAKTIVVTAWLTAGAIACATAAFDHHPGSPYAKPYRRPCYSPLVCSSFPPEHPDCLNRFRPRRPSDYLLPGSLRLSWWERHPSSFWDPASR